MLRRWSVMGQVAVALVVATGLANTLLVFGGWPQRWATAYQLLLGLKVLLVLGMIGLALRNRSAFRNRFGGDTLATLRSIRRAAGGELALAAGVLVLVRSEEHTSELQSLMRISYAVFCLKKKTTAKRMTTPTYNYIVFHYQQNN